MCVLQEHNVQQLVLLGGLQTASGSLPNTLGGAGLLHSPQQHLQQAAAAAGSSVGGIPVRSMAAAAAAAAAASGIAPVDHDAAAAAVQQLAAGLLPLDGGALQLCPRCGRLHSGGCEAARKAKCPRCYRKAHLCKCWSRCIACNLVHAPGRCRASSSAAGNWGQKDQQQQVQLQQQNNTGTLAGSSSTAAAADEDLESFPSLSEGMAGSGAPAAATAAQPCPPNAQLEFGPRIGRC
jgi:hypothetical protein